MDLAILLSIRDESLAHVRASLESLDRTLPPRWSGAVGIVDHTNAGFDGPLPRPGWQIGRSDRNAAVAATASPMLCFLEAGTIPLPGWLPPLLRLGRSALRAGCVGNIHREPYSGLIEHAGIGFDAAGLPVALGRDCALLPREPSDRRAAVSLACGIVPRRVFEQLHGFDPNLHGRLADVDFCLRAAGAGYRHHVANRSVIYHYDTAGPITDDPGLGLYRERWGERAQRCHERRARLRQTPPDASYSPERWEMAREARRLLRLQISDTHGEGFRYLRKHSLRPWRYNAARVARALEQALAPLPAPIPLPSTHPTDTARTDDGWLFDPPPQP